MATLDEVVSAARRAVHRVTRENELPAYMGRANGAGGYEYDTSDGRKYVRVVRGSGEIDQMAVLLDTNIADDSTQAVWIKFLPEGQWGITRIRIEGY